ncbi:hypothetical protein VT84_24435 [Gemmata sp. SH-PL17]|uniref:hypothetical protein n=1 Tax=Gemmata sp. SH-PL17 TaxID=1630693 RepID=UPI00078D252F|nr:hypothetical protein [Gemmata sp. SH-PL17]AMV27572.1 hypothetical protein VT84_24435 [Gemmata sp. SH-PL17]
MTLPQRAAAESEHALVNPYDTKSTKRPTCSKITGRSHPVRDLNMLFKVAT